MKRSRSRKRAGSERHVFVDSDDGTTRSGTSLTPEGHLCGIVEERFVDGSVWTGRWRDNARNGAGSLSLYDGVSSPVVVAISRAASLRVHAHHTVASGRDVGRWRA